MFETFESQVSLAISVATLIGIVVSAAIYIYKKGKSEGSQTQSSENTHEDLYEKVNSIDEKIDGYQKKNDEEHKTLFEDVTEIKTKVSYIRGKIDQALKK